MNKTIVYFMMGLVLVGFAFAYPLTLYFPLRDGFISINSSILDGTKLHCTDIIGATSNLCTIAASGGGGGGNTSGDVTRNITTLNSSLNRLTGTSGQCSATDKVYNVSLTEDGVSVLCDTDQTGAGGSNHVTNSSINISLEQVRGNVDCDTINFSGTIGSASICDGSDATGGAGETAGDVTANITQNRNDISNKLQNGSLEEAILGNVTFREWISEDNGMKLSLSDDGSNLILGSNVAGNNYLEIGTDGSFMDLYSNPNVANGYLMVSWAETQGASTFVNIYEGGTGHNRFWDSGSMRIGGNEGYLCSQLTTDVDCDTPSTGADLVVQDDIWLNGTILNHANDWTNVTITESQITDLSHTVDTSVTNATIQIAIGQVTNLNSALVNPTNASIVITESQISDLSHTIDTSVTNSSIVITESQVSDLSHLDNTKMNISGGVFTGDINVLTNSGFGTTSPISRVYINETSGDNALTVEGGSGGQGIIQARRTGSTQSVTLGAPGNEPQIEFSDGTLTWFVGKKNSDDSLRFSYNERVGIGSDKMVIELNGNVGIGETNPSYLLEVNGTFRQNSSVDGNGEWNSTCSGVWRQSGSRILACD